MSSHTRDSMPEILEYALRQAGVDLDNVADWRISTALNRPIAINIVKDPDA